MQFGEKEKFILITTVKVLAGILGFMMVILGFMSFHTDPEGNYTSQCNAEKNVSLYLVFGGILTLLLTILRQFMETWSALGGECRWDTNVFHLTCSLLVFFDIFAFIVTLVMMSFGSKWTMSVFTKVQYKKESEPFYCPSLTYRFSFWILIFGWIVTLSVISILFYKARNVLMCQQQAYRVDISKAPQAYPGVAGRYRGK